jgi:hypothetical protein
MFFSSVSSFRGFMELGTESSNRGKWLDSNGRSRQYRRGRRSAATVGTARGEFSSSETRTALSLGAHESAILFSNVAADVNTKKFSGNENYSAAILLAGLTAVSGFGSLASHETRRSPVLALRARLGFSGVLSRQFSSPARNGGG